MLTRRGVSKDVLANPEAHAFLMSLMAAGEAEVARGLQRVARLIPDPQTRRRVTQQQRGKSHHAELFSERVRQLRGSVDQPSQVTRYASALERAGLRLPPERLERREALTRQESLHFFCGALVDEERGIQELRGLLTVLGRDPETGRVLREVLDSEIEHLSFAAEQLRQLASSGLRPKVDRTLKRFRQRERLAHREAAIAAVDELTEILGYPQVIRLLWRMIITVQAYWGWLTTTSGLPNHELRIVEQPERLTADA